MRPPQRALMTIALVCFGLAPIVGAQSPTSKPPAKKAPLLTATTTKALTTAQIDPVGRRLQLAEQMRARGMALDPSKLTTPQIKARAAAFYRARHWAPRGYTFDPTKMTAAEMDVRVATLKKDLDTKLKSQRKPNVDPGIISPKAMAFRRERADAWRARGLVFDPAKTTALEMDVIGRRTRRAAYWKLRGFDFDPSKTTVQEMTRQALSLRRLAQWKARGHDLTKVAAGLY